MAYVEYDEYGDFMDCDGLDFDGDVLEFAMPSSKSALRAASASNPRSFPCPTCERPNLLTPADVRRGYQCDACADLDEMGGGY